MSETEEKYMESGRHVEFAILSYYEACQEIGVTNEQFADDIISAVFEATEGVINFEEWVE